MTVMLGDCCDVMPTLDAESVDAIVTDPPYDLTSGKRGGSGEASVNLDSPYGRARIGTGTGGGFMGKSWDSTGVAFDPQTWREALRVAKPGAYLLAFGGTRTVHRMTCAIEDAGWIIRDMLMWAYASGFPKSLNLPGGLGTALKPAWEPIVMARKPLRGTVAANVARWGTGALNIDATRIAAEPYAYPNGPRGNTFTVAGEPDGTRTLPVESSPLGRWPANVILTDPVLDGGWEGVVGGGSTGKSAGGNSQHVNGTEVYGAYGNAPDGVDPGYGDSGTYSRFFMIPKASRSDREPVLSDLPERVVSVWGGDEDDLTPGKKSTIGRRNHHPTVKPVELMRHLVRLVTPPGGLVLDPFLGSGTTALACEDEGMRWTGIEREPEYVKIAEARLNGTQRGIGL